MDIRNKYSSKTIEWRVVHTGPVMLNNRPGPGL
jgi:hypothetical protein